MGLRIVAFIIMCLMVGCIPNPNAGNLSPTNAPLKITQPIPENTKTPLTTARIPPTLIDIQRTPDPAKMNINQWESVSPDGKWIAQGVYASPKAESDLGSEYIQLTLQNVNEKIQWTVIDSWRETGLGYTFPKSVAWSQDGEAFYYTNVPVVEGCRAITANGSDLQKVDLSTGMIRELIPNSAFWISLSPNEKQAAAIMQVTQNLRIINLNTGEGNEIEIDPGVDFDAGYIVWSPNGESLALTIANLPCTGDYLGPGIFAESTSIIFVNISTFEVQKIINEDERRFITSAWLVTDKIELKDPDGTSWIYYTITGQINKK